MLAHVVVQMLLACECLLTIFAFVRGVASVQTYVVGQMLLSREGFLAVAAAMRRFTGMLAHVVC